MPITQISIAVENQPGKLHAVCDVLEKEHINIKAIMAATKLVPVQLHVIVDDPEKALNVLDNHGYTTAIKEVIAVSAPDHPGGLNAVLRALLEKQINIDTLYPFINPNGSEAILILEVDKILEAKEILKKHWIKTYGQEIYRL